MILKNTEMILFWGGKYITQKLKKKNSDKNPANNAGTTLLHILAATPFSIEIFQDICPHVKDINPADRNGLTPLHIAAQNGHINLVELIVSHKGDSTNIKDGKKRIPLHYVAMNAASQPRHEPNHLPNSLMEDFHQGIRLTRFLYLAGFIMEPFLEGITLLKHLYINPK